VHLPGSCSASSAFPYHRMGRLSASFREHDFSRVSFRGYSYFVMFRPLSLLASQIAPTAASCPAGQPRLLHPSRTCVVTFTCIGHAIRPTTGNWRNEDFHLARFAALSAAHDDSLTILKDGFVDRHQKFNFSPLCYPSYKASDYYLGGSISH